MAEEDGLGIAAVLAADTDFEIGAGREIWLLRFWSLYFYSRQGI